MQREAMDALQTNSNELFLESYFYFIYIGKRLYDIELMKIELKRIYDAGLMEKLDYLEAEAVLRREHTQELRYLEEDKEK